MLLLANTVVGYQIKRFSEIMLPCIRRQHPVLKTQVTCPWTCLPTFSGCNYTLASCYLRKLDLPFCPFPFRKMTGLFYCLHVSYIRVCERAFVESMALGKFKVAEEYGRNCLRAYTKLRLSSSIEGFGYFHYRMAKCYQVSRYYFHFRFSSSAQFNFLYNDKEIRECGWYDQILPQGSQDSILDPWERSSSGSWYL